MESRALIDMQNQKGSSLVGPFTYTQPLLPYERQLIEVLGISEQEYRHFASEVTARGRLRSAAYAHIPDIQGASIVTAIVVSLVVGAVMTGVAMLLAPKPPKPDENDPVTQKNMGNQQGQTRFNKAVGFDGVPQIALLGSRIPLIFGQYIDGSDPSGGTLVEPLLVWSRMFSNGSFQTMEALMALGNAAIDKVPDLAGCMIAGTPVANIYRTNYALSWSAEQGANRLEAADIIYGEAETAGNRYGLFVCPTITGPTEGGFSMASTPINTTTFGVYSSIPNGGRYSVNWRVVSLLYIRDGRPDDPKLRLKNERTKIVGKEHDARVQAMRGTGRVYSPRCGVIGIKGKTLADPSIETIEVGDTITYQVNGLGFVGRCGFKSSSEVTATDIEQSIEALRDVADAALQVSEVFVINQAVFRVKKRPTNVWRPEVDNNYELECINFLGTSKQIGVIGTRVLTTTILAGDYSSELDYPTAWYCLSKVDLGQVKNTRPCEVTEIGIKSQVWARSAGLCNFPNVPTPKQLHYYDRRGISLNAGTQTHYMKRTSFFRLGVKEVANPVGIDNGGKDTDEDDSVFSGFDNFNDVLFCVRGTSPVDVFNSIRITHPKRAEYEFRFIPLDHTHVTRYIDKSQTCYMLNSSAAEHSIDERSAHYGKFNLTFKAESIRTELTFELSEFEAPGRRFEDYAQVKELSRYNEVSFSCDSSPEHQIVYINESRDNKTLPEYSNMVMMGLKLRSLNQVQSFRQMQVWLYNGINVDRYIEGTKGPSNNLADIVKYILSSHSDGSGLGLEISGRLVDEDGLKKSALFLANNGLRFDGAISDAVNIRDYLSSLAPLFLCNFVVANGKFSMLPGVPVDSSGKMLTSPVPIAQYFNDSTVIEGSYNLKFLPQTDRMQFRAVMKYRKSIKNSLTALETIMVTWGDETALPSPQEDYDMTAFCTRESQAFMTARYLLSLRRRVDHVITFKTIPDGLALQPGDYIRYDTIASPYTSLYSGVIRADGTLLSVNPPADGTYFAYLYVVGADDVTEANLVISGGKVSDPAYFGALFNIPDQGTPGEAGSIPVKYGVYLVEEISLGEDGLVQIMASHFPVDEKGVSKIVEDVLDQSLFKVIS